MHNPFLRNDDIGGSFLPQDYVQRQSELRANIICLTLFGVVMFGIVGAFFVTNRQWLQVRRERQAITVEYTQQAALIEQLKNLETQKSEMMAKAEVTTALVERVPRSILMSELVSRMPDQVALLELHLVSKRLRDPVPTASPTTAGRGTTGAQIRTLTGKAAPGKAAPGKAPPAPPPAPVTAPRFEFTLRLIGVAHANNNIADYLAALKACSLLDAVELKYIQHFTLDKHELRKFEIEATLRRDADARGIEPVPEIRRAMEGTGTPNPEPEKSGARPVTTATPKEGE